MGLLDGFSEQLQPHTNQLAEVLGTHGWAIRDALNKLVEASDLGRPDLKDIYQRFTAIGEYNGGTKNTLGEVKPGEIWLIQSLVSNGVVNASPHYTIRSGGYLVASVIKEGIGSETQGGDIVCLPGEILTWEPETTGKYEFVLTVIRRKDRRPPIGANLGPREEELGMRNTHEPGRDEIPAKPETAWQNTPQQVENTVGRPALVAPPFAQSMDPTGV